MPTKPVTAHQKLMQRLEDAGGQGLDLDRIDSPTNLVTALIRKGHAHISFGRLYISRRPTGEPFTDQP